MPLDVDCYKPTLVDNNVQVLDAALEIDLNYWVRSDDLFRLLINDDLLLMNLWGQDVVVRDGKVDASNCENPNEGVEKFMDAR